MGRKRVRAFGFGRLFWKAVPFPHPYPQDFCEVKGQIWPCANPTLDPLDYEAPYGPQTDPENGPGWYARRRRLAGCVQCPCVRLSLVCSLGLPPPVQSSAALRLPQPKPSLPRPNRRVHVGANFLSLILLPLEERVVEVACGHERLHQVPGGVGAGVQGLWGELGPWKCCPGWFLAHFLQRGPVPYACRKMGAALRAASARPRVHLGARG